MPSHPLEIVGKLGNSGNVTPTPSMGDAIRMWLELEGAVPSGPRYDVILGREEQAFVGFAPGAHCLDIHNPGLPSQLMAKALVFFQGYGVEKKLTEFCHRIGPWKASPLFEVCFQSCVHVCHISFVFSELPIQLLHVREYIQEVFIDLAETVCSLFSQ